MDIETSAGLISFFENTVRKVIKLRTAKVFTRCKSQIKKVLFLVYFKLKSEIGA